MRRLEDREPKISDNFNRMIKKFKPDVEAPNFNRVRQMKPYF